MLNERLREGFDASLEELGGQSGVEMLTANTVAGGPGFRHTPAALSVDAAEVAQRAEVREECFGPAVLLARYGSEDELLSALGAFEGQLSAAVFAQPEPDADAELIVELTRVLTERVGRLAFDAYPTGVAVTWAMQHGGPYPATTTPDHTSVGLTSTRRFMRPVAFQSAPEHALPEALRDANPRGIWRRVDGELTNASL
jgi:acyl-CoA reductase-like NAD-dependent aldehyde dehydrogenase